MDILKLALKKFEYEVLYTENVAYECKCSRERTEAAIKGLSVEDLQEMVDDGKGAEVVCHFCNERYNFSTEELKKIISKKV